MSRTTEFNAHVDDEGRLILPPEVGISYGLETGVHLRLEGNTHRLILYPPVTHLRKVYLEVTNRCNLSCRTCMRNIWHEESGQMRSSTFARVMESLRAFSPPPLVFFGGFGEPLSHPGLLDMVSQVKSLGSQVELITNGTLLTEEFSRRLIEARLDGLWLSLDGATPESYADVRLGALLPEVLANLKSFQKLRIRAQTATPEIGIVFVAMKRNINDLPSILRLGHERDATRFLVTNVLPYTEELRAEVLFTQALGDLIYQPVLNLPHVKLPKIDAREIFREPLYRALRENGQTVSVGGGILGEASDRCPFITSGATAINWEGEVSPCLPLSHDHTSFLEERKRRSRRYVVGNVNENNLEELWNHRDYATFRERVQSFGFSHCVYCLGCDLSEANEEDCRGNRFPTCGGCLWAQGVIQCP